MSAKKVVPARRQSSRQPDAKPVPISTVAIIGLGLMGRGIAACLLAHGCDVIAFDVDRRRARAGSAHIQTALSGLQQRRLLTATQAKHWQKHYRLVSSLKEVAEAHLVIECIREDLKLKQNLFAELDAVLPATTIIASNTSSLPISLLQSGRKHPERYIGMHWGEPAQIMRYLEIIPGQQTSASVIQAALKFGKGCGKEPALLKQDIRGFLSNRLMYAMMREACHLVEAGIADVETVDQSFRNDIGWWALLAGPFRWMDLTGIPAYAAVMEGLLPELSTSAKVPAMMKNMVAKKAAGISNQKGFYKYTKHEAEQWEKNWVEFTYDMRKLASKYTPSL